MAGEDSDNDGDLRRLVDVVSIDVASLHEELAEVGDLVRQISARQAATEAALDLIRELVAVVIDSLPASEEGTGGDGADRITDPVLARIDVDAIASAVARPLVEHLLTHSVRRGDFTLKSGRRSDWFIDAKQTTCRPEGMLLVAEAALAVLPADVTAIGGLTMGADSVAFGVAAVAATRGRALRSFSIRKEVKDHGGGGRIAGALEPGDKVVIVEDTVTRGVSMIEAADVVGQAGAEVVLFLPVVDRGGTVAALAAERGIELRALVTASDLGFAYED